jgi:hypothetical protein
MAPRTQMQKAVRVRLMPGPVALGAEPDAFAPTTQEDDEGLASLVYISGATPGQGDSNTAATQFVGTLSNSVYSEFMNNALQSQSR